MKGFFHMAPPLPKHSATWDVTNVLNALKVWGHSAKKTNAEKRRNAETNGRDRSPHAVEEAKAKDMAADGDDLSEEF
uniref:Uncharacterized protein n=1 Tax=Plectus sambesii TaxID=2011161 RepID=A0A914VNE5_9BILA